MRKKKTEEWERGESSYTHSHSLGMNFLDFLDCNLFVKISDYLDVSTLSSWATVVNEEWGQTHLQTHTCTIVCDVLGPRVYSMYLPDIEDERFARISLQVTYRANVLGREQFESSIKAFTHYIFEKIGFGAYGYLNVDEAHGIDNIDNSKVMTRRTDFETPEELYKSIVAFPSNCSLSLQYFSGYEWKELDDTIDQLLLPPPGVPSNDNNDDDDTVCQANYSLFRYW